MVTATHDELLALETAGWESLCESRGGTFYGNLMAPGGLFVLVNGVVMTREEIASSLDGAPGWESFEIFDTRVVDLGNDAVAFVYRASSTRSDLARPFEAIMSSVYRRIEGDLRLALYQQTALS